MIPVSVVVMTRNEAANLPGCLAALGRFAQVFVVDSASTDGTPEIAAVLGAVVVPFRWDGRYPKKKQWCLETLPFAHDWVLYVDADERLTPTLVEEIAALMARRPACAGYFIEGRPVFLGRRLRFGAGNLKLALLDRRRARFPEVPDLDVASMWEVEGHYQPVLDGPAGRLRAPLWHADEKPPSAWFERHNRYSDWEAALRADGRMTALIALEGSRRRRLKWLLDGVPLRPLAVFLHGYVLKLGFLDGVAGLHHALARAFYYWQVGVKIRALRQSAATSSDASRLPPNAFTRSKVRLRTDGSSMR
ncbi:MAG TPA: glycosyltransferase family 2 protein [Azospirillum sp.]|nr:glycosyltransferase family 2 protein [Azospirillum sp.]